MFENQHYNNVHFENHQLGNGFYGDSGVETITPQKKGTKIAVISGITSRSSCRRMCNSLCSIRHCQESGKAPRPEAGKVLPMGV